MADERTRGGERRADQTGDVEDRARSLLERYRAGMLTHERLELAARCGDEAARYALPGVELFAPGLEALGRGLSGDERLHAALLASRDVLPVWAEHHDAMTARCVLASCEARLRGAPAVPSQDLLDMESVLEGEGEAVGWTKLQYSHCAGRAIARTGRFILESVPGEQVEPGQLGSVLWDCSAARSVPYLLPLPDFPDGSLMTPDEVRVDRTLRRDLAAWALGST